MCETVITLHNRLQIASKCIFCKRVKHSLHTGRRLLLLRNIVHSNTGILHLTLKLSSKEKHTRFQIVPVQELSKNVPVTFLNVFILLQINSTAVDVNMRRLFGSCENLRMRRLFDNNRSIEYFEKRDTDVSRGGTSVLRLSRSRHPLAPALKCGTSVFSQTNYVCNDYKSNVFRNKNPLFHLHFFAGEKFSGHG